jgi:RimJ/RimL family protein N-acetyltransferase
MRPVALSSPLVRLDQPIPADADVVFEYCQDPLFERFLTVPWPYSHEDADSFISEYVPDGWTSGREYTWAIRAPGSPALIGVIGLRVPSASIGYWVGGPHRGHGYVPEAQRLVAGWAFSSGVVDSITWQCLPGNIASARTAWKTGFTFEGEAPADHPHRDGSYPPAWTGRLLATDDRAPKTGWPADVVAG